MKYQKTWSDNQKQESTFETIMAGVFTLMAIASFMAIAIILQ